jgi:hypothetical protein
MAIPRAKSRTRHVDATVQALVFPDDTRGEKSASAAKLRNQIGRRRHIGARQ